jgi:tetratricopeptide (TPR) repeat protein
MKSFKLIPILALTFLFCFCTSKKEKAAGLMKSGEEKIRTGEFAKAIEDLTKVIELDPSSYEAWYYRANAKFNLKKAKEALIDYNKSIELKNDFADAYYNRAFCKQYLSDNDGACADWDKAARLGKTCVKDLLNVCH